MTPVIAAIPKAIQVTGSTSRMSFVTGRLREATPSSRRSTTAMEPSTSVIASTWMLSNHGNSSSFARTVSAQGVS